MEKIKKVLHTKKGSDDSTSGQASTARTGGLSGEGSHLAAQAQKGSAPVPLPGARPLPLAGANSVEQMAKNLPESSEGHHPIYDKFTHHDRPNAPSAQPKETVHQAPHFSNTTNLNQPPGGTGANAPLRGAHDHLAESSKLSPAAATNKRPNNVPGDGVSNASIKSGVQGYPHRTSAAAQSQRLAHEETGSVTLTDRTATRETHANSPLQQGAAVGAAAIGTKALAPHPQNREPYSSQDNAASHEPRVITTSNREFPLAGGVTFRQTESNSPTKPDNTAPKTIDTLDGGSGSDHGYQGSTETTAAAGSHSTFGKTDNTSEPTRELGGLSAENKTSGPVESKEKKPNPDALAAAGAAYAAHEHGGHGHEYKGDPCPKGQTVGISGAGFTKGPHLTDTANRADPHLHIPGEFPDPTPIEEREEPPMSLETEEAGLTGAETRASGHAPTNVSESVDAPDQQSQQSTHNHGRDAALAGAAVGAGVYAGRRDENTSSCGDSDSLQETTTGHPRWEHRTTFTEAAVPAAEDHLEHHYGRNAAPVGRGASALGAGAYYADQKDGKPDTGPASATIGPHKSNIANVLDPRVLPEPDKMKNHIATGPYQSDTLNRLAPGVDSKAKSPDSQHHYGRDAAIVGGVGAAGAGVGVYSAAKHHGSEPTGFDSTSNANEDVLDSSAGHHFQQVPGFSEQRYDTAAQSGAPKTHNSSVLYDDRRASLTGGTGGIGAVSHGDTKGHTAAREQPSSTKEPSGQLQNHYGRDAALVGGAGAVGYGASEATQKYASNRSAELASGKEEDRHNPQYQNSGDVPQQPQASQHHYAWDAANVGGTGTASAGVYAATRPGDEASSNIPKPVGAPQPTRSHKRADSALESKERQHHYGRDAAIAGAGIGAGAGAYEYSQHEAEQERLAQQKQQAKELERRINEQKKEVEAQQKQQQKAMEKEHKKDLKELEKEHKKDQKHGSKLAAEEEKHHHKEMEKEERRQQKEIEEREKALRQGLPKEEGKEKKHHLFGFLHRDKKDNEPEERAYIPEKEDTTAIKSTDGGAFAQHPDRDHGKERHRLHKDPPPGHPAKDTLKSGYYEHVGTDGPIQRSDIPEDR